MYLMARAEIEPNKYTDFWKHLPAETPLVHTLVMNSVRTQNMEDKHHEILNKIHADLPLLPNEN